MESAEKNNMRRTEGKWRHKLGFGIWFECVKQKRRRGTENVPFWEHEA